jgi:hypothetical protein
VAAPGAARVHDVVVALKQLPQDRRHAGFGLAGQLHLDGGAPLLAAVILGDDDAVGEVEGLTALTLAELPFADPPETHRLRFGADQTHRVAAVSARGSW